MGRRIKGEQFLYVRPLDGAQIKANKIIINTRCEEIFKYLGINKGSRVKVVDEFGREYKGKMDTGKNTYLHCLGWFQGHPEVGAGDVVVVSPAGKRTLRIGKLTNTQSVNFLTADLPPPPERVVIKRRPGRPKKAVEPEGKKKNTRKRGPKKKALKQSS